MVSYDASEGAFGYENETSSPEDAVKYRVIDYPLGQHVMPPLPNPRPPLALRSSGPLVLECLVLD